MKSFILAVTLCTLFAGCGAYLYEQDGFGSESYTGTIGFREFESAEELARFNSDAKKWLAEQSFIVDTTNSCKICQKEKWDQPGTLFCKKYDEENLVYVFIPSDFQKDNKVRRVDYHAEFRGPLKKIKERDNEFESIRREFKSRFLEKLTQKHVEIRVINEMRQ